MRAYAARLLQVPKFALCLIDDIVGEERLVELFTKLLPSVHGARPLFDVRLFMPPPQHGHL